MLSLFATAALLALPSVQEDVERQFDFWIGQWTVQNRNLQPDGSWKDGDVSRAQISPVCGERALLEQWVGPAMNGFSLRAWDPEQEHWTIVLFWTTDGNGGFGRMLGRFRHGRGEFFPTLVPGRKNLTRYTFSDGLANTCRWDSARTSDFGVHWSTDWIMEFSRTRAAAEITQTQLFAEDWNARACSPHAEARELDWTVGRWQGTVTELAEGTQHEARFTSRIVNADTLVYDLLETRAQDADDWDERATVRGWVAGAQRWEAWRLTETDTVLRQMVGEHDGQAFVYTLPSSGRTTFAREVLVRNGDDALVIEEAEVPQGGGAPETVRIFELERVDQG